MSCPCTIINCTKCYPIISLSLSRQIRPNMRISCSTRLILVTRARFRSRILSRDSQSFAADHSWTKSIGLSAFTMSTKVKDIGPVSTRDNRVLKGPLDRSLRSFARTAHSAQSLRSAPLRYAPFTGSLTSLTPLWYG